MSYSSSEYETDNESLNSDRSESVHSENERDTPWQLDDTADGPEFTLRSQHDRRNRRQRHLIDTEIMVNKQILVNKDYHDLTFSFAQTDNEDGMDIETTDDSSDSNSDDEGSELNADELADVERNRKYNCKQIILLEPKYSNRLSLSS
jgi:hypothetical protein